FQFLHVGQKSAGFYREDEALRHSPSPAVKRRGLREAVEGVVDFYGIESFRVILEPLVQWEFPRVEIAAPVAILPPGAADKNGRVRNLLMRFHLHSFCGRVVCGHTSASSAEGPSANQRRTRRPTSQRRAVVALAAHTSSGVSCVFW